MPPDVRLALTDLDQLTPAFFIDEMWAHSRSTTLRAAQAILAVGIQPNPISPLSRTLRKRLSVCLAPYDDEDPGT